MQLFSVLSYHLHRLYQKTRLWSWPSGESLNIAVVALPGDLSHLEACIDAIATFHPSSTVAVAGNDISGFRHAQLSLSQGIQRDVNYDVVILLHPWPYISESSNVEWLQSRSFARSIRAKRKWVYFRNLELWDNSLYAKAKRRIIGTLIRPIDLLTAMHEERVLTQIRVELENTRSWVGDVPCQHRSSRLAFSSPRRIFFCPQCGMGWTPVAREKHNSDNLYGPGYAAHYRYVGQIEQQRYWNECASRANEYLAALEFEPSAVPPEDRIVLDYGCGSGRYASIGLNRGWRYLGIDSSLDNIEYAMNHVTGGEFCAGDLNHPNIQTHGPFGMIYLSHVLEHIPDPVAMLQELRKHSAHGGWLYIEVPDAFTCTWTRSHCGFANREHVWDFTPAMLSAIVKSSGWEVCRQHISISSALYPFHALLARNTNEKSHALGRE